MGLTDGGFPRGLPNLGIQVEGLQELFFLVSPFKFGVGGLIGFAGVALIRGGGVCDSVGYDILLY